MRQPDLFFGDKVPPRTVRPQRAYLAWDRTTSKSMPWASMASWVRNMNRLFAVATPSSDHYRRVRETARTLTPDRIAECRHDDDLGRCEAMLLHAHDGWLYGLDRAFTKAERGELLVEVRNRRHHLSLGRDGPKIKGPRLDPTRMPLDAIERLIQTHRDIAFVDQLRHERLRRLFVAR
jgi:hypothetical protein